jgi:hypothetical protein
MAVGWRVRIRACSRTPLRRHTKAIDITASIERTQVLGGSISEYRRAFPLGAGARVTITCWYYMPKPWAPGEDVYWDHSPKLDTIRSLRSPPRPWPVSGAVEGGGHAA